MQQTQIAAAVSVQATMAAHHQRIASRRRRRRAPLVAIDRIIDMLETRHLAGSTSVDDHVCQQLSDLSALVPLTDEVVRAVDTRSLHGALLDLQEVLLEAVMPSRRLLTRYDDEPGTTMNPASRGSGARFRTSVRSRPAVSDTRPDPVKR